jgi:hypothetical protein
MHSPLPSISPTTRRTAALTAMGAAAAMAASGLIQLTDAQSSEATVVGIEHVTLAALTATLVLLVPMLLLLARAAGRPWAGRLAAAGMLALAPLTVVSNVRGEDPGFFAAVAVPSNLLWLAGSVVIGLGLRRTRAVPGAVAVAVPVAWFLALPLSALGGGIVAGAIWVAIAWGVLHGALWRTPAPPVQVQAA